MVIVILESIVNLCVPDSLPGTLAILFYLTNLDSIFKSRDITLSTKVHLVKAMVFPVVMYGCEQGLKLDLLHCTQILYCLSTI